MLILARMPCWLDKTEKTPNLEQLAPRLSVLFSASELSADIFVVFASERRLVRALCGRLVRFDRGLVLAKIMATLPSPQQSGQSVKEGVKRDYITSYM